MCEAELVKYYKMCRAERAPARQWVTVDSSTATAHWTVVFSVGSKVILAAGSPRSGRFHCYEFGIQ